MMERRPLVTIGQKATEQIRDNFIVFFVALGRVVGGGFCCC